MTENSISFAKALGERYLAYALSTITSRSLPDARDGLKPVHRRILYAMRELKLNPNSAFKKSARIVGDVMGRFHPHGDSAIYDALVRLAQDFSVRYPMVDGQGNFGNIDGDNAAAMRYTEARLTAIAEYMMEGIDEDSVGFKATYDGENDEPIVLPSGIPNLLANGATGIAVGMATNIPPHNLMELGQALLHILAKPQCSVADLMVHILGPDFPTGGVIQEDSESLLRCYETGKGSVRIRAKYEIEKEKGGNYRIIITEVPYQINKSKLIEQVADIIYNQKNPLLADILDESAEDIRVVITPKSRNIEPEVIMEFLFKNSDCESRFHYNLNALGERGNVPKLMNIKELLEIWLAHRFEILQNRAKYKLGVMAKRLELLEGYLVCYLNLDLVIHIIRTHDEPKSELMAQFPLNEVQAEAILNMRLKSLRKLEEMELIAERDKLLLLSDELQKMLGDETIQRAKIRDEIKSLMKFVAQNPILAHRRSQIDHKASAVIAVNLDDYRAREPITAVVSKQGWIRGFKNHLNPQEIAEIKYREGDEMNWVMHSNTAQKLLFFTSSGRFLTLGADKLPSGRSNGEPLRIICELSAGEELIAMLEYNPESQILIVSKQGRGFIIDADKAIAQTKNGKQIFNCGDDSTPFGAYTINGDIVAMIGENRRLIMIKIADIPVMARGRGVKLQNFRLGGVADVQIINQANGLVWAMNGESEKIRVEQNLLNWLSPRGGAGKSPPFGFPKDNKFHDIKPAITAK